MTRRIAIISEHASPLALLGGVDAGGQNVYVGQLAVHLARIGYAVDVFTRRDDPDLDAVVPWTDGVRIVHVDAGPAAVVPKEDLLPFMGAFTDEVCGFIRRHGTYDLVHANFFMSGLVAAEVKRRIGIPFVVTFHALGKVRRLHQRDDDRFPDDRFAIEERVVREADHVIAECPQDEEDLIRLYDADPVRVTVIPAGVDPDELMPVGRELARAALGITTKERVVLHVGRMVPRKGVDDVIRGFARFRASSDMPVRLIVAGGDGEVPDPERTPELGRLLAIARDEGVGDAVAFVGRVPRDRLRFYYSAADVFVTTPWYEPFGITPLEAMACGTPVIGSNVGGIKFTVRDGETGYLVPAHDPQAVADRLHAILHDPRVRAVFRSQAVRRVHDLFTWRHVTAQIAALYERLLRGDRIERLVQGGDDYQRVERAFGAASAAITASSKVLADVTLDAADELVGAIRSGGKVLVCGNGGSAAESQHLVAELVGRFRRDGRPALPAIALTTDTSVLTAWANDASFDEVFSRQVEALGRPGDVLVGLSTSGNSPNVLRAFDAARRRGIRCVAMVGGDGGRLRALADVAVVVPTDDGQRTQEVHLLLVHVISELVEERLAAADVPDVVAERGHATIGGAA
ncbi:MAG TPA: glycosyltransferase [Actinomycetota bacterium]|nr:glycosyltransferase [Actinomycetota bacterium]